MEGDKDLLGLWISENEGAKFWLSVWTDLQNRGLKDRVPSMAPLDAGLSIHQQRLHGGLRVGAFSCLRMFINFCINYRILYFFYERTAAVLAHGIIKERQVPPPDLERAIERKLKFQQNSERHSHQDEV